MRAEGSATVRAQFKPGTGKGGVNPVGANPPGLQPDPARVARQEVDGQNPSEHVASDPVQVKSETCHVATEETLFDADALPREDKGLFGVEALCRCVGIQIEGGPLVPEGVEVAVCDVVLCHRVGVEVSVSWG